MADLEDEEDITGATGATSSRARGKRSGAARTVRDTIVHDIDWPHFHIYTAPGEEPMTFQRLSVQEFVYGFMHMIDQPDSRLDKQIMWDILKGMMEDATEYPWHNVRNFYWVVGSHVENVEVIGPQPRNQTVGHDTVIENHDHAGCSDIETNDELIDSSLTFLKESLIEKKGDVYDDDRVASSGDKLGEKPAEYLELGMLDMGMVALNNQRLKYIFDVVATTGQANFRAARVPLPSALNIPRWRRELTGYRDAHIVEYLEFGWPIGINRDADLCSQFASHPSALAHPRDVEHYVATELKHGALLGPFDGPLASTCHFSPLMTRPKKDSRFRRVIVDLSWPKGQSVNDGISKKDYIDGPMTISLPTPDDMERAIVQAGRGAFLYKTDLARGYRQLRVDPLDWPLLSFQHEARCFMDICPPFGLRSSAMAMQRVSEALVFLHSRRGYVSWAYIDDFGGAEPSEPRASSALRALQRIMDDLGVVQAAAKICLPSQAMIWLGIFFDTVEMSMSIPEAKLAKIMLCLAAWRGKTQATRREMQSLLGLLNFVASVAPPARLFTNRMLDALREAPRVGATSLSSQFKLDVVFFAELLPLFNGRKIMGKQVVPYQHQVELDACLTGCGAVAGDQFYAEQFPDCVVAENHCIAHLELLNIVVAIKVWQRRWTGWTVQIYCDNLNSVFVLQTGKSRDPFMRACAREVLLYTAAKDIDIQICHRPGLDMVWADALSREHTHPRFAARVRDDPHLRAGTRLVVPQEFFRLRNTL